MKKILINITAVIFAIIVSFMATSKIMTYLAPTVTPTIADNSNAQVLSATDSIENESVTFNVDAIFNKALIVKGGKITADNIVYGIRAGSGVGVGSSDPQNPVITNTGVLSVAGKTGELKLEQGSGITIDGLKITNSGIISLTSGTGVTVSGSTITNSDLGSSQNIFKTISVTGQDDIVAGSNTDTLTFTAGSGITLSTGIARNALTISSNDPNIAAGWTHGTDSIYLTTSTDSVGIGTTDPSYKLHVVGTEYVSDTLTAGGALGVTGATTLSGALLANGNVTLGNAITDSLTFVGRIANGTSLIPDTDLGSDLGNSSLRFENLWVANIYSNDSVDFSGKTVFSYAPTDTIISQASVLINPTTSTANGQLLGLGIAGYEKALIDEDGDIILGYSDATSAPATDYPLTVYGHNGTNVAYIDTSGNLNISGGYSISGNSVLNATTLGTGVLNSSLTSTGTLNSGSITSGFGSIDTGSDNIVTTGTVGSSGLTSFTGNSLAVNSITSTGNLSILPTDNVGIGTATPAQKLTVLGDLASSVATNVEGLKLTDTSDTTKLAMKWTGTGVTLDTPLSNTNNKLSNYGFETDLTGWSSYSLNDQFTTSAPTTLVSGGLSAPAPSLGGEMVTNGGFDSDTAWSKGAGWSISSGTANGTTTTTTINQNSILTSGTWYQSVYGISSRTAGGLYVSAPFTGVYYRTTDGIFTETGRAQNTNVSFQGAGGGFTGNLDNVSFKALTLSSLFSTTTETTANKIISAGVTLTAGTQAGLVLNADDTYSNFIIAYHDGTKVYFEKNIGGTYSSIFTAVTATYVADAQLKVIKLGNVYQVVYNNVLIGSGTVSDAGIVAGTKQGLFSTYASNSFTNFSITTNIDGSLATDGTNTRTVTDTKGKLSITGGQLSFATGGVTYGNPGLWYPSVSRVAGKMLIGKTTKTTGSIAIGFDTGTSGFIDDGAVFLSGVNIWPDSGISNIGTSVDGTEYQTATILRGTGAYTFIKGGIYTNWTLLWINSSFSGGTLYPGITTSNVTVATADNIRIPTATWLPTPLAYDAFETSSGLTDATGPDNQTAPQLTWVGGTKSGGGTLTISPSLGDELVTNGGFDSDTAWTKGTGWSIGSGVANATAAPVNSYLDQNILTAGGWYQTVWTINSISSGYFRVFLGQTAIKLWNTTGTKTETQRASIVPTFRIGTEANTTGEIDNIFVKQLTLSSLFSTVSTSDTDVIADANVTSPDQSVQAGVALNLNSASTPTEGVVAYLTRTDTGTGAKVTLDKFTTATTWTNVQAATTVVYSAGATLRVIKDGTKYRVYYNNALVGAEVTISDATLIDNTIHGLFSTYSTNSFDNFTLFARGTGNEYVNLPAEDLTATRDTSKYYAGDSSLKLVASTNDQAYTQSVTLPDTSTYNLSAYAYTDGSAVTTADLDLYYGSTTLTTSYTSVGNGWYKLSGTLTGVASAKDYGVLVHAGKTVYLDSMALATTTGGGTVLGITNSTTGLGGLSVESTTTLNSGLASLQALIVKGFSGQTEDLQEWHTSTGSVLGSVSSTGGLTLAGNLDINGTTNDIAGTLNLSGNSLTSSGALSITPNAGSNVSFSLSGTGDMIVNTNDLVVDTSLGYVGIGTALPTALLDLSGTSGMDAFRLTNSGAKVLGLSYGTNAATFDVVSTDPTNKLLNGTFDADLTSWSEVPSYTLNDQFTTDKTPAELDADNTTAEPTGGIRTVTDTNDKLSITGGQLSFATGGSAAGDPGLWYGGVSRSAGIVEIAHINVPTSDSGVYIGLDSNQSGNMIADQSIRIDDDVATSYPNAVGAISSNGITAGTDYYLAHVMKSSGAYQFIKGGTFTNWTLLYIQNIGSSATVYPGISAVGTTSLGNSSYIRIPTTTWLPTPLAYDDFASADMTSKATGPDDQTTPSLAWTGGSDAGGVMTITPTLGSELWDADAAIFASGTYAWIAAGTNTLANVSNKLEITYVDNAAGAYGYLNIYSGDLTSQTTAGVWYQLGMDINVNTGSVGTTLLSGGISEPTITVSETTPTTKIRSFREKVVNNNTVTFFNGFGAGEKITLDNLSLKPLTLSSLFSTVSTSDADVIADANVTLTAGTQAGLVLNLDSTSSPANFIIVYHDGTSVKVDEAVAGVYTNKQSTAVTYSAGATLRAIREGTKLRVYYNNALVGAELTMTANTNTKHGLFSTYSGNSFDNFTLFARGTGAEYTSAPFEELVATRNTTTKYNNSTASVQLVTSGTDANYLQSVNVGDTSTYNLIAYAYTTGAAVTSADLSLYYGSTTLTTSYTAMGGTGWYKLSGSLTGEASAKDFGVRVKAGKTVYVDEMHLQVGTGTTQNMYVLNSNTGVTGLNVQGLINGTLNGVATYSKAGTISDADFGGGVSDGMMGIDTTNHRIYFREGGSWSYSAKAGGFQIPKEEVLGLSTGDYLLPYVESFMNDGAVHGMYQKFDLNKLLATQGAVTFVSDVTFLGKTVFNKDTAGTASISIYSSQVDVKFTNTYETAPAVKINLVIDASDSALIKDGQKAYIANITPQGFSIMLPSVAMRSYIYNWIAINTNEENTTKSQSPIQEIIDNVTPTPIASDTPMLTVTPIP